MNDFINNKSGIGLSQETLKNFEDEITQLFTKNFAYKYKSKAEKVLKNYIKVRGFTESESFYLGFFIGLLLFQLSIICTIAWYYDIDMDKDEEFKSVLFILDRHAHHQWCPFLRLHRHLCRRV